MQWWFNMSPEGDGVKVVHEFDRGHIQDGMLKGLRDNYEAVRAGAVRSGTCAFELQAVG